MASLISRAAQRQAQERRSTAQRPATGSQDDFDIGLARLPEESWRRVALRALVAYRAAANQLVIAELQALPSKREPLTEDEIPTCLVSKAEVLARPRLSESKSQRVSSTDPGGCNHPKLLPRGGKTFWYACRDCPARWPRTGQQEQIDYTL